MKINPIILIIVIILGLYVGINITKEEPLQSNVTNKETTKVASTEKENIAKPNEEIKAEVTPKYNYKIIHEIGKRFDGAISYYVLIDPVDAETTEFKDIVHYTVNDLVQTKGNNISVEIYDNKDALDLHYKLYGDMSLDRVLNREEYIFVGNHHVAGFSGELETDLFYNTLYYYPAANVEDNPLVGKYAGAVEFNPN